MCWNYQDILHITTAFKDIVIGIFGTRIGTPTAEYISGTVEEIKRHVAEGKTTKVYFSDVPVSPSELNTTQYNLVKEFQHECKSTGLYATFISPGEFARDFKQHLDIELNQPRYRWLNPPTLQVEQVNRSPLSQDAMHLLKAAATEDDGTIILQRSLDGDGLRIGAEEFIDGTPRSAARWREALRTLENEGALEVISENMYRVTAVGFKIADSDNYSSENKFAAFEDHKTTHTRQLSDELNNLQRDLLRFLLLKGGSAMNYIIHPAWAHQGGFDWNGLIKTLTEKGLISVVHDPNSGHSTVTVNQSMSKDLKEILFPRNEGDKKPAFIGL